MPQRIATIRNVTKACRIIRQIRSQSVPLVRRLSFYGRNALRSILQDRMNSSIDCYLEDLDRLGVKTGATVSTAGTY